MFHSDQYLSADLIREWMGVFDGIKSVAKYAGVSFLSQLSSTSETWAVLFYDSSNR
jgi:hypothetical protein